MRWKFRPKIKRSIFFASNIDLWPMPFTREQYRLPGTRAVPSRPAKIWYPRFDCPVLLKLILKSNVWSFGVNLTFLSDTTGKTTVSRRNAKRHPSYYCWCNNARWINCRHSSRYVTGKMQWIFLTVIVYVAVLSLGY